MTFSAVQQPRFPRASLILILLGLYVFAYVPVPDSLDGEALLAVASSIVRRGSADMNVIAYTDWIMPPNAGMGQIGLDGEVYSKKGIAPSLTLVPFVLAADLLPPLTARAASMLLNPLITALTSAILYSLLRWIGFSTWVSWLTSFLYGTATMAVIYTGTLFGEPLAAFAIASAVLAFARWRDTNHTRDLLLLGASFALLIGINLVYIALVPLGGIFILLSSPSPVQPLSLRLRAIGSLRYVFRSDLPLAAWGLQLTSRLSTFALPIALALIATALFNNARFGSPFNGGYRFAEGEGFIYPIPLGLFGLFISVYRGVFWYNPILLAAIPGAIMLLRRRLPVGTTPALSAQSSVLSTSFSLSLAAGIALAFAGWWSWHGGIVWGPRFLIPALPVFALCLAPVVESVLASRRRLVRAAFIALVVVSLAVQVLGVLIPYLPHYAYLKDNFFNPDPNALVGSLDDRVLTDPSLSPIVGHAQLLFSGFPLQPGWILRGPDPFYVLAAALLIIPGGLLLFSPSPVQKFFAPSRLLFNRFFPMVSVSLCLLFSLFLVAWRGSATQPERDSLASLASAIGDADSVVLATSFYGPALIDLETYAHIVTINAPISEEDERGQRLWSKAFLNWKTVAYLTWMPPVDPLDWMARRAYGATFMSETWVDNHRLIKFAPTSAGQYEYPGNWRFGDIQLMTMGIKRRPSDVIATFMWGVASQLPADYTFFAHLLDAEGKIISQHDLAPVGGYAPTSTWIIYRAPRISLAFPLDNSEQAAAIRIGWIDPTTGERLPVTDLDGIPLPDDFVVIPIREN